MQNFTKSLVKPQRLVFKEPQMGWLEPADPIVLSPEEKNKEELRQKALLSEIDTEIKRAEAQKQLKQQYDDWNLTEITADTIEQIRMVDVFEIDQEGEEERFEKAQLEEDNKELEKLADHDGLTGLFNRRFFDKSLLETINISNRNQTPISILLFDLDEFKQTNDTFWHDAGDYVLKIFAEILGHSRAGDIHCRYGWEEFVVILPNTNWKEAQEVAERIRVRIEERKIIYDEKTIPTTTSIGISTRLPSPALQKGTTEVAKEMIVEADAHLYKAKEWGRNRIAIKDSETDEVILYKDNQPIEAGVDSKTSLKPETTPKDTNEAPTPHTIGVDLKKAGVKTRRVPTIEEEENTDDYKREKTA